MSLEKQKEQGQKGIKHQNTQRGSFKQKTDKDFTLLGLTTSKSSQLISLKGKPSSFRSRERMDIAIRNPQDFSKSYNRKQIPTMDDETKKNM